MVVSCCADGCNNRFGERQRLGFYVFPAVSRARKNGSGQLEAPQLEILEPECGHNFASGKLTTSHIASATIQLCAVAIKSFLH